MTHVTLTEVERTALAQVHFPWRCLAVVERIIAARVQQALQDAAIHRPSGDRP